MINRKSDGSFSWVVSDWQRLDSVETWADTVMFLLRQGYKPHMFMYERVTVRPDASRFVITDEDLARFRA